jgi:hypothetical protein
VYRRQFGEAIALCADEFARHFRNTRAGRNRMPDRIHLV